MSARATGPSPAPQDGWERRRSILLSEYERVALTLFADRGFNSVTVDDIAAAAGVTTRTLFRYFGSKQDALLAFPRRGLAAEIALIDSLEPGDDPVTTAWESLLDLVSGSAVEPGVVELWNAATADAPEVVARVRGERIDAIFKAYTRYAERSLAPGPDLEERARVLAGVLCGLEFSIVESVTLKPEISDSLLDQGAETVARLAAVALAGRSS